MPVKYFDEFMYAVKHHHYYSENVFCFLNQNMVLILKEFERSEKGLECTEKLKSLISGMDRLVSACLERHVTKHI